MVAYAPHGPSRLREGRTGRRLSSGRGEDPAVLARRGRLPQVPRQTARRSPLRLLRGPADRERHAAQRARAHARRSRTSSPATRRCAATTCPRKAGWDTHGLPVEVEVEKELRIHGKATRSRPTASSPSSRRCIESVFRYTERVGGADRAARLLGRPGRRLRHLPQELRRERLVGALRAVQARACSTRATRSSGGGRRAARRSRPAEVGQGYKTVDDPSRVRAPSRSRTSRARRCSPGRRRRGPCRRTSTPR